MKQENEIDREARRIWAQPRERWAEELRALPKEKTLHGVEWRYRLAIGLRLQMAEKLEQRGCLYAGWPNRATETGEHHGRT